jgi:hypothetical protein
MTCKKGQVQSVARSLMQQLKISLPDDIRVQLDAASAKAGHGLGEEIRRRLQASFDAETLDPPIRALMTRISEFATWVSIGTGHEWHAHAAAMRTLAKAITAHLARLRAGLPGEAVTTYPDGTSSASAPAVFGPGELPSTRVVAPGTDDPDAIGLAIETLVFHMPPMTPARRRQLDQMQEKNWQELRNLQQQDKDQGGKS